VWTYCAFGSVLRSALEFPELTAAPDTAAPDWDFVVARTTPPEYALHLVGERRVGPERYRLWQYRAGLRLEYSHAGSFDVPRHGNSITWYHRDDVLPELVRSIALGSALALRLECKGFLCIHGSAVSLGNKAVAFVGPKHFGKSTLAAALTAAGARLIGDDLLVVSPGPPALLRPGVASVRLWADMAATLPLSSVSASTLPGVKTTLTGFLEGAVARDVTALETVYVLHPEPNGDDARAVWRTRLPPMEAAVALAQQTKLPPSLVGHAAARDQLAAAAKLASNVPTWRLHAVRDVARLEATVRQIMDWSCTE
jgi:hypothetical protein